MSCERQDLQARWWMKECDRDNRRCHGWISLAMTARVVKSMEVIKQFWPDDCWSQPLITETAAEASALYLSACVPKIVSGGLHGCQHSMLRTQPVAFSSIVNFDFFLNLFVSVCASSSMRSVYWTICLHSSRLCNWCVKHFSMRLRNLRGQR